MLTRRLAPSLLLLAALVPAARAQTRQPTRQPTRPPADLVRRAVEAMGGESNVRGLTTTQNDYYFAAFALGQSELPESPPRANIGFGRSWNDYRSMRRALIAENRAVTGQVTKQRQAATASVGLNDAGGTQTPMTAGAVAGLMRFLRLQPERLMIAALDNPGSLTVQQPRRLRGQAADGLRMAGQDTLTIWFDRITGLPVMYETVTDDPILGDRTTQTWLTRWQPAGPVRLPRQVDVMWNGQLQQHVYFTAITANAETPDSAFAIPDSIARRAQAAPAAPAPAPIVVNMVQLGPSVWRAEGATHHTLVVEQPDQIVLVEAPLSTERVRAVLDTVRSRFPAKRIGVAVMTHYHWDHASGIREAIADGIPMVTMEQNQAFIQHVAAARRTVRPDNQATRHRVAAIRTFTDSLVIGSGETMVVLYRMPSVHAEGLLAAWVPSAHVLFTSDVVNPGPQGQVGQPGSGELVALARARGLTPEKYAGGHGVLINWPDIERAAAAQP